MILSDPAIEVSLLTPNSRAIWAKGRFDSTANLTADSLNSAVYFLAFCLSPISTHDLALALSMISLEVVCPG